ncbi:Uncharacterised protein [Mycobacteroides abscessus subsp. abscessus]|nr:Uncharacterised protein [Mycobacteroides abscessus subsp. abscessus]
MKPSGTSTVTSTGPGTSAFASVVRRNSPEPPAAMPPAGAVKSTARSPFAMTSFAASACRSVLSGATGELSLKYFVHVSKSVSPDCSNVPFANEEKLSPPAARKLRVATR